MESKNKTRILQEAILKLLRKGYIRNLRKLIEKVHPADIATVITHTDEIEQSKIFQEVKNDETAANIISEISDKNLVAEIINRLDYERICNIFHHIESDDAADIIGLLPKEDATAILKLMKKEDAVEVKKLLKYDPTTAGGIMDPNYFALKKDITAEEGLKELRGAKDIDMVFYIYVVDDEETLCGVISLRQLILAKNETKISKIMNDDVFYVQTNTDQEEVSKMVSKYDLLAVPVVDNDKKLVGMVTVDDVIDVIKEEATEDILKMSGTFAITDILETSIFKYTKARFPWLLACFIGGIISSRIINFYEHSLTKIIALATFIPIVLGMSGNVGSQSSSIIVRNIALGKIHLKNMTRVVFKELRVGFSLGILYGLLLGGVAYFLYKDIPGLHYVVSISILIAMTTAATVGSIIPLSFEKLNVDPALASGPFVTTIMDIVGVTVYFLTATFLMSKNLFG
jgi:magnesium transporter